MSDSFGPPAPLAVQLRSLAPHVNGHRWAIARVALLGTAAPALGALEPLALKRSFDTFVPGAQLSRASQPLAMLLALLAGKEVLATGLDRLFWSTRLGIDFTLLRATVPVRHRARAADLPCSSPRGSSGGAQRAALL